MTLFVNVRGCNGSGKTTLLRSLVKTFPSAEVRNCHEFREVNRDGEIAAHKPIPFTFVGPLAILGDYRPPTPGQPEATTAGCDRVKTQAATKNALEWASRQPGVEVVLFEGVVVSTIYGPWKEWAETFGGMTWAFLDTPLSVCLARIQKRNGGKPIKEDQVADKHITIARVAEKAVNDGLEVIYLPWESALSHLRAVLMLRGVVV